MSQTELAAPSGHTTLAIFERQVLVFPLLVVLLACTSFLFGGRCAAWQWWTAVAAVILVPFMQRDRWRSALRAAGLFALLLFALRCLIPPLVWDITACPDMPAYHLPMIQLLMEGWNPVQDPMAEIITGELGLDPWGMAPLHVAFLPKTMAVLCALANRFVRDPYALAFPGPLLLWLGVFLSALRTFQGLARWAAAAAVAGILPIVVWWMPVDLGVAFASCGLLFAMHKARSGDEPDWLSLTVWTAWMMNLKLNGVLGAFVFCAIFAISTLRRRRHEWKAWFVRFAAFGFVLVLLLGMISWNPLGTSWRSYGHPLYPFKTINADRFPVKDLTWDLQGGNEDYALMDKAGLLAHAYLSPTATVAFYRKILGRDDFNPNCSWWKWAEFPSTAVRLRIWILFALLLILPMGRPWAAGGLALLALVPNCMVGFTRYQAWLSALGSLCAVLLAEWAEPKLSDRVIRLLKLTMATGFLIAGFQFAWRAPSDLECKAAESTTIRGRILSPIWTGSLRFPKEDSFHVRGFVPRYNYLTSMENRCRLLARELDETATTKVLSARPLARALGYDLDWDERDWHRPENQKATNIMARDRASDEESGTAAAMPTDSLNTTDDEFSGESWMMTPFGYWIPTSEHSEHIVAYLGGPEHIEEEVSTAPHPPQVFLFLHAWLNTYPKEVWRRL